LCTSAPLRLHHDRRSETGQLANRSSRVVHLIFYEPFAEHIFARGFFLKIIVVFTKINYSLNIIFADAKLADAK